MPHDDFAGITFREDTTRWEGDFIRVYRGGRRFGKILVVEGVYQFYRDGQEKLGEAELQSADLEGLKAVIEARYRR